MTDATTNGCRACSENAAAAELFLRKVETYQRAYSLLFMLFEQTAGDRDMEVYRQWREAHKKVGS